MNYFLIRRLILKDWHFSRLTIAVCLTVGAIALFITGLGGETMFYIGSVLFITVLIGLGITLAMLTVIYERKEQTLPFVMSLPISVTEYTTSKILANLLIFLLPWLILAVGSLAVIWGRDTLPNGMIPFVMLVVTEIFVAYCLVLAVALVTESEVWTIATIVICQLFFNYFLYFASHFPSVAASMEGPVTHWSPAVMWTLGIEAVLLIVILGATYLLQARKKDFL